MQNSWNKTRYHGRFNRYPFTDVVSFVMRTFGNSNREAVKILDLGYGGAHHLLFLAQEGFDYYGIDGADEALEVATERMLEQGFSTDNLSVGTFDNLPYDEDFFDCVIDRGSLTCNRIKDIPPLLQEVNRVLKPGGYLFSMILHETCSNTKLGKHLGNNDYGQFTGRLAGAGVLHFTNVQETKALFSDFNIVDIQLMTKASQMGDKDNAEVEAWMITICRKS